MEVGCLACRDFVSTSTALHFFSGGGMGAVKSRALFFERGGYSSVAILIFTSHDPIAWNRLLTNSFVSFTQSFCFTVKIIFRRKHNQVSNTLSHTSAKTESENNRRAAQGTVTELHPAAH